MTTVITRDRVRLLAKLYPVQFCVMPEQFLLKDLIVAFARNPVAIGYISHEFQCDREDLEQIDEYLLMALWNGRPPADQCIPVLVNWLWRERQRIHKIIRLV